MSEMEPEVKKFLQKVVSSIFLGMTWLTLNMTLGIFFGLLFVNDRLTVGNLIFYAFFLVSLYGLIRFYIRTWKEKFPHG
jgi:hypothetical protein